MMLANPEVSTTSMDGAEMKRAWTIHPEIDIHNSNCAIAMMDIQDKDKFG